MSLRVAYITEYFVPEPVGPPLWIAETLRDQGLRPVVITGVPNYPSGKVQAGYNWWRKATESAAGFRVVRFPLFPSHDASAARRMLTYASFALSTSAGAQGVLAQADIALVYGTPATAATPAVVAARMHGTPFVLYVQDLWPDSIFATGFLQSPRVRTTVERVVGKAVSHSYRSASHIAAISPGMRETLISRGVPAEKVSVIYNWADEAVYRPHPSTGALRTSLGIPEDHTVLLYAGNHGYAQRLDVWLDAMTQVADDDIHLVFVGAGADKESLQVRAARSADRRIHFLPPVPNEAVPELAGDADALVISLANDPLFNITLPGKTQSIMAMGKAIVASGAGDLARAIADSGSGWCAPPEDASGVARVIKEAKAAGRQGLRDRGAVARRFYDSNMSARLGGAKLAALLDEHSRPRRS